MGRTIQANRMKRLAQEAVDKNRNVIADFVCPTENTRRDFEADYTIWMDTIKEGRFEDTNKMFEPPIFYNFRVTHKDADMWAFLIKGDMLSKLRGLGVHNEED
jgi:adenylylsulfate kinase